MLDSAQMRRLWLVFCQATTIAVAVVFVVSTFRPEWLPSRSPNSGSSPASIALVREAAVGGGGGAPRADSYRDAVDKAAPSVVNIFTSKEIRSPRGPLFGDPLLRRFFGDAGGSADELKQRSQSLGSGVIVSDAGYILTNHHVVESADEIEVALANGKKLLARVVGNDPETDLAVLRVDAEGLPSIRFGTSESLRVGDVVLAIGNPFGVGQTVTSGIVSALGRSGLHINTFENFIQTDAAINPGNSGGPLVDSQGNLVGVNTAIYSRTGGSMGIGFAIPVSTARLVMEQIIRSGSVTRGWIGVEVQEITPPLVESFNLPDGRGAIIAGVLRGGPADKAGIKPGDVLREISGKPVPDPTGMLNMVAALAPGTDARLRLLRKGDEVEVSVQVGRRPKPPPRVESSP